jgi:hypothetical protein
MFAQPDYVKQGKTFFGCAFVVSQTRRTAAKPHASHPGSARARCEFRHEIITAFAVAKRL